MEDLKLEIERLMREKEETQNKIDEVGRKLDGESPVLVVSRCNSISGSTHRDFYHIKEDTSDFRIQALESLSRTIDVEGIMTKALIEKRIGGEEGRFINKETNKYFFIEYGHERVMEVTTVAEIENRIKAEAETFLNGLSNRSWALYNEEFDNI